MQLTERQARLLQLWRTHCGARRFPAYRDFDELELQAWLGDLHLLEVVDGGRDFRYRIYSTGFAQHLGRRLTGKLMSETPEPQLRAIGLACYGEACRRAGPILIRRPTVIPGPLPYDTVRDYLVLPLGEVEDAVDRLLVLHDRMEKEPINSARVEYVPLDGGRPFSRSLRSILRRAGVKAAPSEAPR